MYSERLLDHFQNPRNVGELEAPTITIEVTNPACGDIMRLSARLKDGRVAAARYQTRGCTAAVAAGSALTEAMEGKSIPELQRLDASTVETALGGVPRESGHALALCVDALRTLLRAWSSDQALPK